MSQPVIILVEPQLVENIGMTARAMMNCGLTELRLVDPRDEWPLHEIMQERMMGAASGADEILHNAKIFPTVQAAMADLNFVYATAARDHHMTMRIFTPRAAIPDMDERIRQGQKVGVMFGRERTGLISDHVALCGAKITIPLNPEFMSLNLAQAVLLIGYEWYQAHDETPQKRLETNNTQPASREEYAFFFSRLEQELDNHGFFSTEEMRPSMVRSLQSMLQRAEMTEQEIRTWHGVISALISKKHRASDGK